MLSYSTLAVDVAEADAYATARAYAVWTGNDTVKEAALRRGQDYIAGTYNNRWAVTFTDATAPDEVKFAIIEAAVLELESPGTLSAVVSAAQRVIREKVGALEVQYSDPGKDMLADAIPIVTRIEGLLYGLLRRHVSAIVVV